MDFAKKTKKKKHKAHSIFVQQIKLKMCQKDDTDAPPQKLKRKLLKLDTDGDGWTDGQMDQWTGVIYMPFPHHFSNGGRLKKLKKKKMQVFKFTDLAKNSLITNICP